MELELPEEVVVSFVGSLEGSVTTEMLESKRESEGEGEGESEGESEGERVGEGGIVEKGGRVGSGVAVVRITLIDEVMMMSSNAVD